MGKMRADLALYLTATVKYAIWDSLHDVVASRSRNGGIPVNVKSVLVSAVVAVVIVVAYDQYKARRG